jgi:hypothetical protein
MGYLQEIHRNVALCRHLRYNAISAPGELDWRSEGKDPAVKMAIGYTTDISSDFGGLCQTDVYRAQTNVTVMSTNISGIKVSRVSWDNFDILSEMTWRRATCPLPQTWPRARHLHVFTIKSIMIFYFLVRLFTSSKTLSDPIEHYPQIDYFSKTSRGLTPGGVMVASSWVLSGTQ